MKFDRKNSMKYCQQDLAQRQKQKQQQNTIKITKRHRKNSWGGCLSLLAFVISHIMVIHLSIVYVCVCVFCSLCSSLTHNHKQHHLKKKQKQSKNKRIQSIIESKQSKKRYFFTAHPSFFFSNSL